MGRIGRYIDVGRYGGSLSLNGGGMDETLAKRFGGKVLFLEQLVAHTGHF